MFDLQFGVGLEEVDFGDPTAFIKGLKDLCTEETLPRASCEANPIPTIGTTSHVLQGNIASLNLNVDAAPILWGLGIHPNNEMLPIVLDMGASCSLMPILSNFMGPLTPPPSISINDINVTTKVIDVSTIKWMIEDYWRKIKTIQMKKLVKKTRLTVSN